MRRQFAGIVRRVAPAAVILLALLGVSAGSRAHNSGKPVAGLQLKLRAQALDGRQRGVPRFTIELRNTGSDDLVLKLGAMLANGRRQQPLAVTLIIADAQGKSQLLELRAGGIVGGRVDPMVVPLLAGASYIFSADLADYWVSGSADPEFHLAPGDYAVEARFTGRAVKSEEANLDMKAVALMPYWQGTVTSEPVRMKIPQ